jgi:TRAP-type mannitol/chloroaromatic compound transport system permease small subunit
MLHRQYNVQKKKHKRQTLVYTTLQRKLTSSNNFFKFILFYINT